MAGIFTDYWKVIKPEASKGQYLSASPESSKLYTNFSWYNKVLKGAGSRFSKYSQYKNMDTDVFVSRALDTIAEEMSQSSSKTDLPFEIIYQNENNEQVSETITMTVRAALRHWCDVQRFDIRLFDITRTVIKFGDCFFRKTSDFRFWQYIDPSDVIGITIGEDGDAEYYHLRTGDKNKSGAFGDVEMVPAAGMVQFSLSSSMGENGPFGESVLWDTVKAYRHLTLLEDSVIIYRIVRAPERRVFFIDVGNMPPQRIKAYLESIKTEMKQKRIPNESGGQEKVDSVMNPMSMNEDFFFAQTADGRGSKVEQLSGGENLGQIGDLTYFQNKFLQGLRIPASYMRGGEDAAGQVTDGKVGIAYIEELRFSNYVSRLQFKLNSVFDKHFKAYLKSAGIKVDGHLFKIKLNDPSNFADNRQAAIYETLISNYNNLKDDENLSERYKLKHFLGMSEDDIQENEAMKKQEQGIPDGGVDEGLTELRMLYDKKWRENRPDIKVDEDFDDHTTKSEETAVPEGEATEATDETSTEGEETDTSTDSAPAEKPAKDKEAGSLEDLADEIGTE